MPRLSQWFVRAALGYLVVGFTIGGLLLVEKALRVAPALWRLLPVHVEFLLAGWTVQFAMGVAFWLLPRFAGGSSRGNETAAWWAFALLNAGIWLAALGPPLDGPTGLVLGGRLAEAAASVAFAIHAWPRVHPPRGGRVPPAW